MKMPKRRILVVDDDRTVCDALELTLTFEGHAVESAVSAEAALPLLEREAFDLVITDYAMPGMKGDELARIIKQRWPQVPVAMITAHAELLQSAGIPLTGIETVISKPFMLETLRQAIAKCCPASEAETAAR